MVVRITDEEWDKLTPGEFRYAFALLRAVDAVDELRDDLNDGEYAHSAAASHRPAEVAPIGNGCHQRGITQPRSLLYSSSPAIWMSRFHMIIWKRYRKRCRG
jgi:hypothetical protein